MGTRVTVAIGLTMCVVGGCGGDSGSATKTHPASSADEKRVRTVVQQALTTTSPSACTRLMTRELREQTTARKGAAALKSCRHGADEPGATTVSVDSVTVHGTKASADIRPSGGSLPFKTATLAVRKEGGRWKVSRLTSGTLDREAFDRGLFEDLSKPPHPLREPLPECAVRELGATDDPEIVRALIKPDVGVFAVPVAICIVRVELDGERLPRTLTECVVRGFRRELSNGALARRLSRGASAGSVLQSKVADRILRRLELECDAGAPGATQ